MAKKITQKRLYNIALYYLSRYESTTEKLRSVLERRVLKAQSEGLETPPEAKEWIQDIINEMQRLGYIDNKRFAENTFRRLSQAGKSVRTITTKLKMAGIEEQAIEDIYDSQEESTFELDLKAAQKLVQKKKLGIYRPLALRQDMRQKDLATLGRAGFSYETAVKALDGQD